MTNTLFYGDNLPVLRDHVPDASVDLVYLDPPFNSNASYNVLFREKSGEESPAQIKAFTDTSRRRESKPPVNSSPQQWQPKQTLPTVVPAEAGTHQPSQEPPRTTQDRPHPTPNTSPGNPRRPFQQLPPPERNFAIVPPADSCPLTPPLPQH